MNSFLNGMCRGVWWGIGVGKEGGECVDMEQVGVVI